MILASSLENGFGYVHVFPTRQKLMFRTAVPSNLQFQGVANQKKVVSNSGFL